MSYKAFGIGLTLLWASVAFGGPNAITYQGSVVHGDGAAVADGKYLMRFSIFTVASSGSHVWQETDTSVSLTSGLFSTTLGDGTAFSTLFPNNANLWLEVEIDLNNSGVFDGDEKYAPRQKLAGAAWAMEADTLDKLHAAAFSLASHNHDATYWRLAGNAGTTSGTHFLGTSDNRSLDLRINNVRALRLEVTPGTPNLIGGYSGNATTTGVLGATIAGGGTSGRPNLATKNYATVGGGSYNTASGPYATVAGGYRNTASGNQATVGGGGATGSWPFWSYNTASGDNATIAGGAGNTASGDNATIAGGTGNTASGNDATVAGGTRNQAIGQRATVGGGFYNRVTADYGTIAGGGRSNPADSATANRVTDSYGTIGGGGWNLAGDDAGTSVDAPYATVAGGWQNTASRQYATVAGGWINTASGALASIVGGASNIASAGYATVCGGRSNTAAGDYSFAAGRRAKALHQGAFVWTDSLNSDFASGAANQFIARATGGVLFISNAAPLVGVQVAPGGNSWGPLSDRNVKENFADVDGEDILARLATIPMQTWNLMSQDPTIRHIGPMAQDFYAAFGVGEDNRHITTCDADGVALAAIQGLYKIVQEKDARIAHLEAEKVAQQQRLVEMEKRLSALESLMTAVSQNHAGRD